MAEGFYSKWNYPNCIGALDGKHVVLQAPANSGSLYYNYKGTFSIVLMALCDANYNVLYVDVGVQGRECDAGVFLDTELYAALYQNKLNIPNGRCLPGRRVEIPYVIAADDAYALSERLMKPFVGRHVKGTIERAFNYRHSRARRVIENVFGIMSSVFRVLRKPILLQPESAKWVTLSCAYLHNFLRKNSSANIYSSAQAFDSEDSNGNVINGTWRSEGQELPGLRWCKNKGENPGVFVRQELAHFLHSQPLPWQQRYA